MTCVITEPGLPKSFCQVSHHHNSARSLPFVNIGIGLDVHNRQPRDFVLGLSALLVSNTQRRPCDMDWVFSLLDPGIIDKSDRPFWLHRNNGDNLPVVAIKGSYQSRMPSRLLYSRKGLLEFVVAIALTVTMLTRATYATIQHFLLYSALEVSHASGGSIRSNLTVCQVRKPQQCSRHIANEADGKL